MTTHPYLQHGMSILHAQIKPSSTPPAGRSGDSCNPFITVSRETCAGATTLGEHLLPLLNASLGEAERSWLLLDKNLINQALTHHHLPEQLASYLPEDRCSEIKGLIGEIAGLHPPLWELEQQIAEAILKFAQLGHVILIGRAAHLITRDLPGGLHIRLVAPLGSRITRAQEMYQMDQQSQAEAFISGSDRARQRHVRTNFEQDSGDPHTYDLVINTDRIPPHLAAKLVIEALREHVPAPTPATAKS